MPRRKADDVPQLRPFKVEGIRGLKHIGGRVAEEYLVILKSWNKESRAYLEMRDDDTIGTLLDAIKYMLLAADFEVNPISEEEPDVKAADFLWQNMNTMDRQTWRSYVEDSLDALDFGFALGEIVLEKRSDGKLWLRNVDPRGPETLDKWGFDEFDRATVFWQRDPVHGTIYEIPLEKMVHITFRGRKGNPQGRSLLRSLYRPWRFLRDLEDLEAIGIERDVGGMPVFTLPKGKITSQDEADIREALKGLRTDETMYMILPAETTLEGFGGGTKMWDSNVVIERKRTQIFTRFFAQFLKLGMGPVGTQALVKGSQDFFSVALIGIQQMLLEAWQQQLVPYLFRFNTFSGLTGLPQITWANPGKVDIAAFMEAYVKGQASQLLTPLREDEERARALLDLPDLPEGEGEGPRMPIEEPAIPGLFESL